MPLIMNDEMELDMNNIDDLFDDGTVPPLPSQPPPKELFQRVDELRGNGCCQGIAWSKWGCIASITSTGRGVSFRNPRCHPLDGSWDLSEPEIIHEIYSKADVCFQHLCWSPNGYDLAAIDTTGRISIVSGGSLLNHLSLSKSSQAESSDILNTIAGAYWINLTPASPRTTPVTCAAIKTENGYRFESSHSISFGPFCPVPQKSALVCVTTNGVLRLVWPQFDGTTWHETTSEIESVFSSNDLVTHAAICAEKSETLLIAFATTSKQLRTARVLIKWGSRTADAVNIPPNHINPVISIQHLAVGNWMDGMWTDAPDSFHAQSSMKALSHLTLFPPTVANAAGEASLPTVLTVRSHLPLFPTHFSQDVHSIIDRWELCDSNQSIHSAFEQLGTRRRVGGTQPGMSSTLRKLEGITVKKIVLRIQSVALDRILCFVYSDGSVEYRERVTLAEIFPESGFNKIIHITQAGFSYSDDEPCLQAAISPTSCSLAQIGSNGRLKWKTLSHHMERLDIPVDEEQYAAVVAAFALSCSIPVMTALAYDDVLAIAHRYTNRPGLPYDIMKVLASALKFYVDYSEEIHQESLIRNPTIQLCLSTHNSLGYNGDLQPRKNGAKIGWISMQIRNCVLLMAIASSMKVLHSDNPQKQTSGLKDADTIRMLSGSVKWNLDLMSWLVDSLLHPEDPSIFKLPSAESSSELDDFNKRLHASNNVALHMLMSSATRGFLICICKRLINLNYMAVKAMQTAAESQAASAEPPISNNLRASYTTLATLINGSVVKTKAFDKFLSKISTSVQEAYAIAGLPSSIQPQSQQGANVRSEPNTERNTIEKTIIFGGPFPSVLLPALRHIFTTLLPELCSDINTSKLFFHDFSLLALEHSPSSLTPVDSISSSRPIAEQALGNLDLLGTSPQIGSSSASDNEKIAHTIDVFQRVPVTLGLEPDPVALNSAIQAVTAILEKASKPSNSGEVPIGASNLDGIPAKHAHGSTGTITGVGIANANIPDSSTVAAAAAALPILKRKARESKRWRRCVRCASVMEEILPGKAMMNILHIQQRKCFCTGHWNLLTGKKVVA